MERGGEVARDASGRLSKGLGVAVWTGTRSYVNLRGGRGLSLTNGNYIGTPNTGTPWTNNFTCFFTAQPTATQGGCYVRCGGFVIGLTASVLRLFNEAGTTIATSTFAAATNGLEYALGVRYRNSDNLVTFFKDGAKQDIAGGALVTSAVTTNLLQWPVNSATTVVLRDIRIWDRYMPDAAYERYYTNPHAFYTRQPLALRAPSFNAGRFFPFMHPSLSS